MILGSKEQIEYGQRSKYVTSVRMAHPMGGRASPDVFGKVFHVATPLQDSVGVITPSSLHYVATTRGSYLPDIDPQQHTLTLSRPGGSAADAHRGRLEALPVGTRLHFIECAGNRHDGQQKTVQETHGMTSCSEWTGVLLSTLLKECGLKSSAKWFVAEGAEEVKGASSIPIAKGDGRLPHRLRPERRALAAAARVSGAPHGSRIRGHLPHQVSAAHQGRRPVLHELQRIRASASGGQRARARRTDRAEVGHHVPVRLTAAARPRILRDQRARLVRWRRRQDRGSIHRWREEVEPRPVQEHSTTHGARPIRLRVDDGMEPRPKFMSRCTDEIGQRQPLREEIANWWKVRSSGTTGCPGSITA